MVPVPEASCQCMNRLAFLSLAVLALLTGCKTSQRPQSFVWPRHRLMADQVTSLTPPKPERFDASGLLLLPTGELLTLRNNSDSILYRIDYQPGGTEAKLVPFNDCFSSNQLAAIASQSGTLYMSPLIPKPAKSKIQKKLSFDTFEFFTINVMTFYSMNQIPRKITKIKSIS